MPRDSNGTYSLPPTGNPVVTLTPISSVWANSTLGDIATALTGSLARDGSGSMTGVLKLSNGAIGAPALSWGTEPTSGLYRNAANDFRYSVLSNDVAQIATGAFRVTAGAVGTPSFSFITDTNTGFYSVGADQIGISTNGVLRETISTTSISATIPYLQADGTAANPSYAFLSDPDNGMYMSAANTPALSAAGTVSVTLNSTASVDFAKQIRAIAGSAGTPSYSFNGDTNSGIYNSAADELAISLNGAINSAFTATRITFNPVIRINTDGTASAPAYTWEQDTNMGLYRIGADDLGFSTAGALRAEINSAGTFFYNAREIGYRGAEVNTQAGASYTLVSDDNGRVIRMTNGGATTVTVPVLTQGFLITVVNTSSTNNCTLSQSGTTLALAGTTTTGNRTIGTRGVVTLFYDLSTFVYATGAGLT